jgi:hypothetical protein
MIKFFRHIRQSLIMENKTGKYLKYAIGEIVLVVIGILIALQINTWNQQLQNNSKEREYYQKFLDDVLLDEKIIESEITATKERLNAANKLAALLLDDETDLDLIAVQMQRSVNSSTISLKPTTNAYDDVKSSGNLNIIRDDALKFKLDRFYSKQVQKMQVIQSNSSLILTRLLREDDLIKNSFGTLYLNLIADSTRINTDKLKALTRPTPKSNYVLLNNAVTFAMVAHRNLVHYDELLANSAEIKEALEQKLASYD